MTHRQALIWTLHAATFLSAALCVAAVGWGARSYFDCDRYVDYYLGESGMICGWTVANWNGSLIVMHHDDHTRRVPWDQSTPGFSHWSPAEMAGMLGTDTSMGLTGFAWTRWDYPDPSTKSFTITFAAVPFWFIATLSAIAPARWYIRRRRTSFQHGMCRECGYDLRATPQRCPECGCAVAADGIIQECADVKRFA